MTVAVRLILFAAVSLTLHATEDLQGGVVRTVDGSTLRRKVLCGYQGWYRCPGGVADAGWVQWSRDVKRIAPETLAFDIWPDMREYARNERIAVPGFTHPDGQQAYLFNSDNAATVLRHFKWMYDYGIDGAWLQQFLVDLRAGSSSRNVLDHVRAAASRTGRVWALSYDLADMPVEQIFETLVNDWIKHVNGKVTADPQYLHEDGRPVVMIRGFFWNNDHYRMTAVLAQKLIAFFKTPGPNAAYLVGCGNWNWQNVPDRDWQQFYRRFPAYVPWNVGNHTVGEQGLMRAATGDWKEDKREFERTGGRWIPVVYPGISADNLRRLDPGTSLVSRRGGAFLWEQFQEASKLGVHGVYVATFDDLNEGTAVFKTTNTPPTQGYFVGFRELPSDWHLRLVGAATSLLHAEREIPPEIPFKP